jgi:Spy/CpxP family protein refolding chaperone
MMTTSTKQNFFKVAIFLLIGLFFVPAIASAFRNGPGKSDRGTGMHGRCMQGTSFQIWNNPQMVEELGLSEEQIGKIKEADFAMKETHLELRSQLNRLDLEMEKAFAEKTVDDSKVLELGNKMSEIRSRLFIDRIESRLKMKNILNPEQLAKVGTFQAGFCENGGRFGRHDKRARGNWQNDMTQP